MVKQRNRDEWRDILDTWTDDPQAAANHMVLGLNLEERQKARGKNGRGQTPTWV
jgi:hypothetical protein